MVNVKVRGETTQPTPVQRLESQTKPHLDIFSWTICQLTSAPTTPVTSHTNHTEFCTALASLGTEHCSSLLPLSPMQAEGTFRVIPAPLWQEVEIPADRLCIVQTSAGQDWMLGQGSYGKVSYT